jgi:dihydroneopterin aldolase
VELYVPVTEPAAREDRLSGTVNYEAVMSAIARTVTSRRFKLVESLCSSLLDDIAQLPGVRALRVAIIKPHPMPGLGSVRIEQWRTL